MSFEEIFRSYGLPHDATTVQPFGNGLINHTWKLSSGGDEFILQRINEQVFPDPEAIAHNIRLVADHLKKFHPGYFFAAPLLSIDQKEMIHTSNGFFRLFPFVKTSHTIDTVQDPQQAFAAAKQFGRFTMMMNEFDAAQLKITIPHFHDLEHRYLDFLSAVKNGDRERIAASSSLIREIQNHFDIVETYKKIRKHPAFRHRTTHHDTKISNVLFNTRGEAICIIDLDTVMPGYFFSDVGDMMRTYLSPSGEEEQDLSLIEVREEFYQAIVEGYLQEMKSALTADERKSFFYAGQFMIFMQAIRFLTDHLNNDVYYGASYPGHNYSRALNQFTLLKKFIEKKNKLEH